MPVVRFELARVSDPAARFAGAAPDVMVLACALGIDVVNAELQRLIQ